MRGGGGGEGGGEEAKLLLTRRVKSATNNLMAIVSHPAEFQVSGRKLENTEGSRVLGLAVPQLQLKPKPVYLNLYSGVQDFMLLEVLHGTSWSSLTWEP